MKIKLNLSLLYSLLYIIIYNNIYINLLYILYILCYIRTFNITNLSFDYFLFFLGGHSTFFGLLNTFVHIVMYTYYLLAAMGPKLQPYLWWKKYLTVFQMIQFVAVMIHAFQLLFIDCNYPKAFVWWIGLHATMFFFLFNEFYQQSYQQKKRKQTITNGVKKDHQQNHQTNGMTNGAMGNSSGRRDAADYYVKGDSLAASELNLRKSYTTTE